MFENHIKTQKTARYYCNTRQLDDVEYVWIALHGYGQLAKFFARNFSHLSASKHLVVVPEAQSRFYLQGVYGRVGATWMTKEDREIDIADYITYLDDLKGQISEMVKHNTKWVVLGFSQGAATACRWLAMGNVIANHLVLWSSMFPPDLALTQNFSTRAQQIWLLMGNTDEYMNQERWQENSELMVKLGIEANRINFEGGHKIYRNVLLDLANRIENA